jgi:hypothetical protein
VVWQGHSLPRFGAKAYLLILPLAPETPTSAHARFHVAFPRRGYHGQLDYLHSLEKPRGDQQAKETNGVN